MRPRLILLTLGGLVFRLAAAPFTAWSPDFGPWLTRVEEMYHGVPLYQNLSFSYPPLYAYAIGLFGYPVAQFLGAGNLAVKALALQDLSFRSQLIAVDIPHPLFALAMKLPMILADVATGLLIASMAGQLGATERRRDLAAAAWFFAPLAIWVGAVHGQFDPIPAFLTVAALAMMWRRQWFGVGLALSLGILFKLYPVYLVPIALTFALRDEVGTWPVVRPAIKQAVVNLVLLGVGLALPIAVFLPTLIHSRMVTAVFSRIETSTVGTGLDLWFPTILPGMRAGFAPFSRGYATALTLLLYGGTLLILWRAVRSASRDRNAAQLDAVIAVLALVLLTSPSTNPQFMVWLLPFVVLASATGRGYRVVAVGLAIIPTLFYLAQWGGNPLAMLTPAIQYYSWPVSGRVAAQSLSRSISLAGPNHIDLRLWMMLVVAAITVALLLIALKSRPPRRPRPGLLANQP